MSRKKVEDGVGLGIVIVECDDSSISQQVSFSLQLKMKKKTGLKGEKNLLRRYTDPCWINHIDVRKNSTLRSRTERGSFLENHIYEGRRDSTKTFTSSMNDTLRENLDRIAMEIELDNDGSSRGRVSKNAKRDHPTVKRENGSDTSYGSHGTSWRTTTVSNDSR